MNTYINIYIYIQVREPLCGHTDLWNLHFVCNICIIYIYIYVYIYLYIYIYIYIYIYRYGSHCASTSIYCIYILCVIYVSYMYTYTHTYTHMYTYINIYIITQEREPLCEHIDLWYLHFVCNAIYIICIYIY